jgi:hypothetical protein
MSWFRIAPHSAASSIALAITTPPCYLMGVYGVRLRVRGRGWGRRSDGFTNIPTIRKPLGATSFFISRRRRISVEDISR